MKLSHSIVQESIGLKTLECAFHGESTMPWLLSCQLFYHALVCAVCRSGAKLHHFSNLATSWQPLKFSQMVVLDFFAWCQEADLVW